MAKVDAKRNICKIWGLHDSNLLSLIEMFSKEVTRYKKLYFLSNIYNIRFEELVFRQTYSILKLTMDIS